MNGWYDSVVCWPRVDSGIAPITVHDHFDGWETKQAWLESWSMLQKTQLTKAERKKSRYVEDAWLAVGKHASRPKVLHDVIINRRPWNSRVSDVQIRPLVLIPKLSAPFCSGCKTHLTNPSLPKLLSSSHLAQPCSRGSSNSSSERKISKLRGSLSADRSVLDQHVAYQAWGGKHLYFDDRLLLVG